MESKTVLEIGGIGPKSAASTISTTSIVVNLIHLPNPYTSISKGILNRTPKDIIEWMILSDPRAATKLEKIIPIITSELINKRSVRLECYGGADRSQAVAWNVLQTLDHETRRFVEVRCLDSTPMNELM
mgnify:CR=1 FL=1|tara:strand:+ start:813 stop:1199 length:387 start_codon:yes stop_codon:yes gene_type:complete